jgi:hypothetical protein
VFKILIILLPFQVLMATTFKPQPIQQQIKESDGLFQGHYLKKKTVILDNGSLATQMVFKISKEVGLQSEFFGLDEVIVHYPGGKLGDRHIHVEGVPKFIPGEKVVLFIRNIDQRYWGMNLGFGSYKVVNFGKETVLVNTVFPHLPKFGQVKWGEFELAVKSIKGVNFNLVKTAIPVMNHNKVGPQRMPASEGQNRSVASLSDQVENSQEAPILSIFWLVVMLGIAGGIFRFNVNKSAK